MAKHYFYHRLFFVCLQVILAYTFPRVKRGSGLTVQILEKPSFCTEKAKKGDVLKVHYQGRLKDDSVFEETYTVGRPLEVTLGGNQIIAGWEEGLKGMCVGERRYLIVPPKLGYGSAGGSNGRVPPDATISFQVDLLALNGKQFHQMQLEHESAEQEKSRQVDVILSQRAGEKDSPFCDACNVFVEQFYETWVMMLKEQEQKVETKDGGSSMPALTYNDDVEAKVQSFCTNRTTSKIAVPLTYADHVQPACERIMLGHKREIVGKFLGSALQGRIILDKKDEVCADMVEACPHSQGETLQGECSFCKAVVEDIAFEIRSKTKIPANKIEYAVHRKLEQVCIRTYYRHRFRASSLQEFCEELIDDHTKAIGDLVIQAVENKISWIEVERGVCVEAAQLCPISMYSKDEF
eukprot:CAMPEP_0196582826 /NCGR_PEP_ID=MMETSP1081-20130531/40880_1 /TAXON_ID=36882 /ORGANISM="Pyramimonas amylifera, Strain CCMP720" /LENGTH=407 /DNA_ID=CAMNT_0041903523 /DNA_START=72 /DNA_END=1295 /DNA_ORIENTATION=+